jgi:response regulator RpfG family c-di-GMP phosphodiesterase
VCGFGVHTGGSVCVTAHFANSDAINHLDIGPISSWQYPCLSHWQVNALMKSVTSVLIVDDEPAVRDVMARWVSSLGFESTTAASADEAIATLRHERYDVAIIDIMMPGHDGLWLANEMRRDHPDTAVVIATAYIALLDEPPPIADLLIKPFQLGRFALAVDRGLQWRKQALDDARWQAVLSSEIRDVSHQISTDLRARSTADNEIETLARMMAETVPDVMLHGDRVARRALLVGRQLAMDAPTCRQLELAARFHDIGKAAMPQALLNKPSPLTPGELVVIRQHVDVGADILMSTRTLADLGPIVRATHESFGGHGYPRRLRGSEIPLASRVIGVVDAYDAMTEERTYRIIQDSTEAVAELLRCSGTQFDPDVLDAFLCVLSRT